MLRNTSNAVTKELIHLHQVTSPVDKMTLSATFGTLWALSSLQGCGSVATTVEFALTLLTAGAAVDQFYGLNTPALIMNTYNSFFGGGRKLGNVKPEVKAQEKSGYVTPEEHAEENTEGMKKSL